MRTVAQLRRTLRTRLSKARPPEAAGAPDAEVEAELTAAQRDGSDGSDDGLAPWRAQLIDQVVVKLKALGYLNDERFAATYSTLRKDNQGLGRRRVAQDLIQKGIHRDVVEREVGTVYAETQDETQARAYLARKRVKQPERGDQKATARIVRMMVRAGFAPGVVFKILRSWNVSVDEAEVAQGDADFGGELGSDLGSES